jgi:phospholipase C
MGARRFFPVSWRSYASVATLISIVALLCAAGCGGSSSSPSPPPTQPENLTAGQAAKGLINHVVIIVQENRTFDNIFGGWNPIQPTDPSAYPGADSTIPLRIQPRMLSTSYGDPPSINAGHDEWQCLSEGQFSDDSWIGVEKGLQCLGLFDPLTQVHPFHYLANDLRKSYWDIASKYVLGDHFFAVSSTSSFPGHQYIVGAQSTDNQGQTIADQPQIKTGTDSTGMDEYGQANGCIDPQNVETRVPVLEANGYIHWRHEDYAGECYDHATVADLLNAQAISWRHYSTLEYSDGRYGQRGVFNGYINNSQWYKATLDWPNSMFDLQPDVFNNALPQVTFIKPPCTALSDHPNGVSTDDAANWVPSVINWIGTSPAWDDAAIFVIWDDWGGFYDHVVPPPIREDKLGPGLRIPFLLISPYGANGKVIHGVADYGSILKFLEDLYDLPSLTKVDANATDMKPFFDFTQKKPFVPVYVKQPFDPTMCPQRAQDLSKIDPD